MFWVPFFFFFFFSCSFGLELEIINKVTFLFCLKITLCVLMILRGIEKLKFSKNSWLGNQRFLFDACMINDSDLKKTWKRYSSCNLIGFNVMNSNFQWIWPFLCILNNDKKIQQHRPNYKEVLSEKYLIKFKWIL